MTHNRSRNFYDISKIPTDWKESRLKYVLSISDEKSLNFSKEKILSLTNKGIIEKNVTTNQGQIAESYEKYIFIKEGQICMNPMDLLSGWVDISSHNGLISPAYYTFILNNEFDYKFINYFLQSNYFRKTFFKLGKGVASHDNFGRWVLTPEELKNISIFFPKIEEQRIISRYLDKKIPMIEFLIEKIKKKIELIIEQKISLINNYVTKGLDLNTEMKDSGFDRIGLIPKHWKIKKLKYIINKKNFIRGPFGGSLKIDSFVPSGYKVYEQKNVIYSNFDLGSSFINEKKFAELSRFEIRARDILMSCSGTIGKTVFVPLNVTKGIINQALLIIRPEDTKITSSEYLEKVFTSYFFQEQVLDNSQGGAMKNLVGIDIFRNVKIPIPPLNEQKKLLELIEKKVSILDKIISKEKERLKLLHEYHHCLISSVLGGKIRVREGML